MIIMKQKLKKNDFHLPHVNILGTNNCGEKRGEAFERRHMLMDIKRPHDYAEHISFKIFNKIIYDHYGSNRSFSKEGTALDHFK